MCSTESGIRNRPKSSGLRSPKVHIDHFRNPFSTFSYGSAHDATYIHAGLRFAAGKIPLSMYLRQQILFMNKLLSHKHEL